MSEYDKTPSFKLTELDSPITSHAVVVAAADGTLIRADGTGLFIARQLVVTAAHVIQHFWNVIEQRPIPSGEVACTFGIHILRFPGIGSICNEPDHANSSASLLTGTTCMKAMSVIGDTQTRLTAQSAGTADSLIHPVSGTPQGGIVSPMLTNLYLHYAL